MSGYPADFNPREALKKSSERYATFIYYGLPINKISEYDELPSNGRGKTSAEWMGRPLWELWTMGKVYQYYIM